MAAARLTAAARPSPLLVSIRRGLAAAADPTRAPQMAAYLKSTMPFHGVAAPVVRAVCKRAFAAHEVADVDTWRRDVLSLWRGARFREERYAAIALCGDSRARPFHTMATLPMFEEMIVTGAWWDYVDVLAANHVGRILENEPAKAHRAMLAWSRDDDMWKRRASILCQLRFKGETDLELLYRCVEPSLDRTEFFLRKAIGWALRQYAWTDPVEVARYVEANRTRLSGLSVREALKNVSASSPRSSLREAPQKRSSGAPRTRSRARRA